MTPSTLPPALRQGLRRAGHSRWAEARVRPLGGGCIHPAVHLRDPGSGHAFLKWEEDGIGGPGFAIEARGLAALADRIRAEGAEADLRVPRVLGVGEGTPAEGSSDEGTSGLEGAGEPGWLLLEYLPPHSAGPDTAVRLGHGLAALHTPRGEAPGWEEDGRIGPLHQPGGGGAEGASWAEFWAGQRLGTRLASPKVRRVLHGATLDRLQGIVEALPDALPELGAGTVALLHGDLWSGNVLVTRGGTPALVDPAVHRGDPEVDLAMMELFGGFDPETFRSWRQLRTGTPDPDPEWARLRRPLYQLHPLLVHVELFGEGYRARTREAAERVGAELGLSSSPSSRPSPRGPSGSGPRPGDEAPP